MSNIVLVKDLSFRYRNRKIVSGLSFELPMGKFLYIKGHNGAGKSTVLKLVCGLFKANSGEISVFQKDPHEDPQVLRNAGVIVDGMGLYKDFSLHDNIILFAREKGLSKEKIANKLKILEKETDINFSSKYKKSSHGMRKIAKLVLSMINDPELFILDEPELALDEKRRAWLLSRLEAHKRNGKSAIIAGTNPNQFDGLLDDVLEMKVIM